MVLNHTGSDLPRNGPRPLRIYYVALNTLFASVLPLALLLFLNVRTAAELFKMGSADTAPTGESVSQSRIFQIQSYSPGK